MKIKWQNRLEQLLLEQHGGKPGSFLYTKYGKVFPTSYSEEFSPNSAVTDINYLEEIEKGNQLQINFSAKDKKNNVFQIKLYTQQEFIPLSDIMPMLENMGLRVLGEQDYKLMLSSKKMRWIRIFTVVYYDTHKFHLDEVKGLFNDAFTRIYFNKIENDSLNQLILKANLAWRDILILRTYIKYLYQIEFKSSFNFIVQTLLNNVEITNELVDLFKIKFNPIEQKRREQKNLEKLTKIIIKKLDAVSILEEDRVLRNIFQLINATLRTNYFQLSSDKLPKDYLAIKLFSKSVPVIPLPIPLYEIFVYSKRFEGIHLRASKVARGGIRVSDRTEDFRREILELMKTQKLKNADILPSGAKGGFVIKSVLSSNIIPRNEVIQCYELFIKGLLDLTDNLIKDKIIKPENTVCYDDEDPYLVVAADKGTAAFSDIANKIAEEYNFWLGDAFASGGSRGYDHKKLGITALGTWEAVKRHFRELDYNIAKQNFTVVAIGDMSGDVFGNGMLYSKNIKLVAAFDSRDIFLDPNPNPEISYNERLRLFNLPNSTWKDYKKNLISVGGGVFDRKQKLITLSEQMKEVLGTHASIFTSEELIIAILKAPVDLLWNGGIGTYVKASTENNRDVGDKTNDPIRVNGNELRCKVVGEGGNLGFTQLGRIEYALNKGLINTDFIDNAGGVNCSDQEVNLKILLEKAIEGGQLTKQRRDQLLVSSKNEVVELVLKNNYSQAWSVSYMATFSHLDMDFYLSYIQELENNKIFNRSIEFIPDEKKILRRKKLNIGLVKPEISTLLAYTKIHIKNEILKNSLFDDPYFNKILKEAFPKKIKQLFNENIENHPLRKEIIATQICNDIINDMGPLFIYLLQIEAWASVHDIIRGYIVVSQIFKTNELQNIVNSFEYKIPLKVQYEILFHIKHLIKISTRWFLRGSRLQANLDSIIENFSKGVRFLTEKIPKLMTGETKKYLETLKEQFINAGLSERVAFKIAGSRAIYNALNIIEISNQLNISLTMTANVYFEVGTKFHLVWFRDQLLSDRQSGYWDALTRLTLRSELDNIQRRLTVQVIKYNNNNQKQNADELINLWRMHNFQITNNWDKLLEKIYTSHSIDFSTFFIVVTELSNMMQAVNLLETFSGDPSSQKTASRDSL